MGKKLNETLIRNLDAGFLYWKVKDDNDIEEYKKWNRENGEDDEGFKKLKEKIFSFKDKDIVLNSKDVRYRYTGTLSDSLMSRKLREVAKEFKDDKAFRTVINSEGLETDYTDIIINLKFKSNVMTPDGNKKVYNPDLLEIEELPEKRMKSLISKKELRKMAYRDGITINGIHYVNFQRTSSKARTGNVLFIDEKYFKAMEEWQNMGIPFREMVRSKDEVNPNPFEKVDIVSSKSYQSLTSSSIIGTLGIDPDRILLIDDMNGEYSMICNVVNSVPDGNKKRLEVTKKEYIQKTDLWDGQSLLDKSVFTKSTYYDSRHKKICNYSDKGFMLLRNHFFKTAVFNTNLQEYYEERFKNNDNPKIFDKYGEEYDPYDVLMVTTKNSVKILKFADIICTQMIREDKKERLRKLETALLKCQNEQKKNKQKITTAKRKLTIMLKSVDVPSDDIDEVKRTISNAEEIYYRNYERLNNEIAYNKKLVRDEQEKLTWRWYRDVLKDQNQEFGVCKYEKVSKFGDKQQLWYQVLGSLNIDGDKLWKLVKEQVNEINLMKKYPAFFKNYLSMKEDKRAGEAMMLALLSVNDDVGRTKWYKDFRRAKIDSILKKLYNGKIKLKDSDFCVLVGNPYEMLRASAGDIITGSILNDWECWCQRYADGEELYGFRSPHICSGNNVLLKNKNCDEWKWFNFTDRIIAVNFWGKGAFLSPSWNGCDTDSDTAFIGNEPIILDEVRKTKEFLIPINNLEPEPNPLEYTEENMAKVDGQLCNDFIGKICNYARDLQSYYWHLHNKGTEENKEKYLDMIYGDICILEVLSNIAIDSAKRRYDINIATEIRRLKDRPYMTTKGVILPDKSIISKRTQYKKSLTDKSVEEYEKLVKRKNENPQDLLYIQEIDKDIKNLLEVEHTCFIRPNFTKKLKSHKSNLNTCHADDGIFYYKLESPMDLLEKIVHDNVNDCDRTKNIEFIELLNPIPKGIKADYNRFEAIKRICLDGIKRLNQVQEEYEKGKIPYDEMYEKKHLITKAITNKLKYKDDSMKHIRKITEWDIHLLLRKAYDIRHKRDKHGKVVKDEKGRPVEVDNRDKELTDDKACGFTVQWVFNAFPDIFIKAIKQNRGNVSTIVEVEVDLADDTSHDDGIFTLYGKNYRIETELYSEEAV